jgi:dimethylhistidine N-methyltransferase
MSTIAVLDFDRARQPGFRPQVVRSPAPDSDFARDMHRGLADWPKAVPAKYFYDRRGSELFEQICRLPEYYPTRTEMQMLRDNAAEIAGLLGPDAELVEFGAGALDKVRLLLDAMERPRAYLPIDISGDHLGQAAAALAQDYPQLTVQAVVGDFMQAMTLPPRHARAQSRVGFFPGSTIGNFTPDEALQFLRNAATMLRAARGEGAPDGGTSLLIGVDLVKDPALLHAAYNDSAGVTAAFNLNLLRRANAELGADFDLDAFRHYAFYRPHLHRIEMHLVSARAQTVQIGGQRYSFTAGESIHTENSYKYTVDSFRQLAEKAGFQPAAVWTDAESLFSLHWLVL